MSEPKRVALTSISTQKTSSKKDVNFIVKAIRFDLKLPESNEKACPEYNYKDLLSSVEKKKSKQEVKKPVPGPGPGPNGFLDPFNDDNDDDVKRIARQFEEKYGMATAKPRQKGKKDDYADIGAGYDESDSFIDNTDAYDEMVPANVTTVLGGFYINSGALEFKEVSGSEEESSSSDDEDEEDEEEEGNKTIKRKRIIEDSSESSSSEDEKDLEKESEKPREPKEPKVEAQDKKPKIEVTQNGVLKVKKRQNTEEQNPVKKKKIEDKDLIQKKKSSVTVKELLREKHAELNLTVLNDSVKPTAEDKNSVSVPEKDLATKEIVANNLNSGSVSKAISDTIESVIIAGLSDSKSDGDQKVGQSECALVEETSKDSSSSGDVAVASGTSESESSRDGMQSSAKQEQKVENDSQRSQEMLRLEETAQKLPEGLSKEVLELISHLKKAAEQSQVGKVKFFTGEVNTMLLSLDNHCKNFEKNKRSQIYEHLAPFVKCKKDTLIRRTKNCVIEHERSKIKEPLKKLKQLIENIMPKAKKHYEKDLQRCEAEAAKATENGETPKPKRIPRKRFPITEEARQLLGEIIEIKKKCFILEGIRRETFEDHLETFMKIGVVGLWPDGWMPMDTLMRSVKFIMENGSRPKTDPAPKPSSTTQNFQSVMTPITLDVQNTGSGGPLNLSPSKVAKTSPTDSLSGITVIPIPPKKSQSQNSSSNVPKSVINNEISVNKITQNSSDITKTSHNSVTITSVDLRTNSSVSNSQKSDSESDCQIIDLTDHSVSRKPAPKSKKYPENSVEVAHRPNPKSEETSHSINNIMSSKYPNFSEKVQKNSEQTSSMKYEAPVKHRSQIEAHASTKKSLTLKHPESPHGQSEASNLKLESNLKHMNQNEAPMKHVTHKETSLKHVNPIEAHKPNFLGQIESHVRLIGNHESHMKHNPHSIEAQLKHETSSMRHMSGSETHIRPESLLKHSEARIRNSTGSENYETTNIRHSITPENLTKHSSASESHVRRTPENIMKYSNPEAHIKHPESPVKHIITPEAYLRHQSHSEAHLNKQKTQNETHRPHEAHRSSNEPHRPHASHESNRSHEAYRSHPGLNEAHTQRGHESHRSHTSNEAHRSSHEPHRSMNESHRSFDPRSYESHRSHTSHESNRPHISRDSHIAHPSRESPKTHDSRETYMTHDLHRPYEPSRKQISTNPNKNQDSELEEVMKNLSTLQKMQEYSRTTDEIISQSSSPVSVIAFNNQFSPTKTSQKPTEKSFDGPNFQEMFQKHLTQESFSSKGHQGAPSYKNNINSDFNISRSGSSLINNPYNSKNYSQNTSGFNTNVNSIPTKPTGAVNHHADDIAMFSNLLYQYGYHNQSGSKQKSPP